VPIKAMRVAADVPVAERTALEVLKTDTPAFRELIEARRNRREEWFKHSRSARSSCATCRSRCGPRPRRASRNQPPTFSLKAEYRLTDIQPGG
jgi:hypothetical protein